MSLRPSPIHADEGPIGQDDDPRASLGWRLGMQAVDVFLGAYTNLGAHDELNRAQIAFELAKLVITGPLAQSLLED